MKLSVYTVIMKEFSIEEIVKKLSEIGYDGVEWRIADDAHIPVKKIEKKAEDIRKLCEENNLEIPALATYLVASDLENIIRVFSSARIMKCPKVRIGIGGYERSKNYHLIFDEAIKDLEKVEEAAKEFEIKAMLEIHHGTIVCSPSLAHRFVSNFNSKYIGVIFDPGNMVFEGKEDWKMGLEILGEYLAHVHVKNSAWIKDEKGIWNKKWAHIDEGIVDWNDVIKCLRKVKYNGFLSTEDFSELPTDEKLRKNFKFLKHLSRGVI